MHLTRKCLLTIEAVLYIALHARPDPVQAKEIMQSQNIPQRYLEQAMQTLVRCGILRGMRGPKGGYVLARERRKISVADILLCMEEIEPEDFETTSPLFEQIIAPISQGVNQEILARLNTVTLEMLCEQAQEKGLGLSTLEASFTI